MTKALITGITGMVGVASTRLSSRKNRLGNTWNDQMEKSLENIQEHVKTINSRERIFLHYGDLNDSHQ